MANFKSSFSRSLEKGPLKQHFRSTALRDLFHNQVSGPENVSQPFIKKMLEYAHLTPEASLAHLNSRLNGLTLDEMEKIQKANDIIIKFYNDIIPKYIKPGISTIE